MKKIFFTNFPTFAFICIFLPAIILIVLGLVYVGTILDSIPLSGVVSMILMVTTVSGTIFGGLFLRDWSLKVKKQMLEKLN